MKIQSILQRIGALDIDNYFLSKEAIEIIGWIKYDLLSHKDICEHISNNIPHADMLRSKRIRTLLLDSLHEPEIVELIKKITGKSVTSNFYEEIKKISFNKNSDAEKVLFQFFDEPIPVDNEVSVYDEIETIVPIRKLFSHQRDSLDQVLSYLDNDKHRCILHMPTGSGKTITAMRVVSTFLLRKRPTLIIWLAYSEYLCEQAIEEFKKIWVGVGDRDIPIYRFFKDYSPDLLEKTRDEDGFIVAGLGKINQASIKNSTLLSKLADRVNLVIMDEAHQAMAPTYCDVLDQLVGKYLDQTRLLGLSATPGRTLASDSAKLALFFNNCKVTLKVKGYKNPTQYLIDEGYLANPKSLLISSDAKLTDEDLKRITDSPIDIPEQILKKIGQNNRRTVKIIGQIQELIEVGHKRIIVFGSSVKNSKDISMILTMCGHKAFHIDANTISTTKKKFVDEYKANTDETIVMCNVGMFTTGFDAPQTSAVVIARPTQSFILFSQMAGRAMRGPKVGGNKQCEIRTITDIKLSRFTDLVENFFHWDGDWY